MISYSQRVCHDCQRGIHRAPRWEEARIDHIKIVKIVRLTIDIERRGSGIAPESNRSVLVCDACKRDALADKQVSCEEPDVAFMPVDSALRLLLHERF